MAAVGPDMFYVSRGEHVRAVLRDPRTFSSLGIFGADPALPPFVTQLDPPLHTELRSLLNQGFTRKAIVEASSWVEEIVGGLIDRFEERGHAEIVEDLAKPLTATVISRLVGVPIEDGPKLAQWSLEITAMLPRPRFDTEEWFRIERYVAEKVQERRGMAAPPDDMITRLIQGEVGGRALSDREVSFHIWLIWVGGLETTAYTLSVLLYQLLSDRTQWERLVGDRSLLRNAIEEGLRFTSANRLLERKVAAPTEIAGCPMHPGQTVFVGLESANFDAAQFGEDAHLFRLDRPNAARHVAFGFGSHTCLGNALAKAEITGALTCLADRLPGLRLAPEMVYETVPNLFFNIPRTVKVVW